MGAFDDFMGEGFDAAAEVFGTVAVEFDGEPAAVQVDWNATAVREEMEVQGVMIGITATIVVKKSRLTNPPRLDQRVSKGGVNYVISGTLAEDALSYTLALDSTDIPQPAAQ